MFLKIVETPDAVGRTFLKNVRKETLSQFLLLRISPIGGISQVLNVHINCRSLFKKIISVGHASRKCAHEKEEE